MWGAESSICFCLQHTVIPLQHLVSFGLNLVSRSFEFQVSCLCYTWALAWVCVSLWLTLCLSSSIQADAFAKKLGYASPLRSGLVKLQVIFQCLLYLFSTYYVLGVSSPIIMSFGYLKIYLLKKMELYIYKEEVLLKHWLRRNECF